MALRYRVILSLALFLAPALPTSAHAQAEQVKIVDARSWHMAVRAWVLAYATAPNLPRPPLKKGETPPPVPSANVVVGFVLDRQGRLLASSVMRSSGLPAYDKAALAGLKRAEPFPRPPANTPGDSFKLSISINYQGDTPPARRRP